MGTYIRVGLSDSTSYVSGLTDICSNLLFALTNGGTGGLFWEYTITVTASVFIYLSISEMASM